MIKADAERIDWFEVLMDLQRKGYSPATIGMAIDVPRTTINGWRDLGASPRHEDGEKLIALWCSVLGSTRELLPKACRLHKV